MGAGPSRPACHNLACSSNLNPRPLLQSTVPSVYILTFLLPHTVCPFLVRGHSGEAGDYLLGETTRNVLQEKKGCCEENLLEYNYNLAEWGYLKTLPQAAPPLLTWDDEPIHVVQKVGVTKNSSSQVCSPAGQAPGGRHGWRQTAT